MGRDRHVRGGGGAVLRPESVAARDDIPPTTDIRGTPPYDPPPTCLTRRASKRLHRRIVVEHRGIEVNLRPQSLRVPTRAVLVDISAGGCCVRIAHRAAVLGAGELCAVELPVTHRHVEYPALVVDVSEREGDGARLVRLRFQRTDPVARRLITRWLGELAVQVWHE